MKISIDNDSLRAMKAWFFLLHFGVFDYVHFLGFNTALYELELCFVTVDKETICPNLCQGVFISVTVW